jgi:hypothetical protein
MPPSLHFPSTVTQICQWLYHWWKHAYKPLTSLCALSLLLILLLTGSSISSQGFSLLGAVSRDYNWRVGRFWKHSDAIFDQKLLYQKRLMSWDSQIPQRWDNFLSEWSAWKSAFTTKRATSSKGLNERFIRMSCPVIIKIYWLLILQNVISWCTQSWKYQLSNQIEFHPLYIDLFHMPQQITVHVFHTYPDVVRGEDFHKYCFLQWLLKKFTNSFTLPHSYPPGV